MLRDENFPDVDFTSLASLDTTKETSPSKLGLFFLFLPASYLLLLTSYCLYANFTSCGLELGTRLTSPRASKSSLTVVTYHVTDPSKLPLTSFSTARDRFIKVISFCLRSVVMIALRMISYFSLLIFTPCFFSG